MGSAEDMSSRVEFGETMRKQQFLFDPHWYNYNHGSYGTYPRPVRDALRGFQDRIEATPDRFIKFESPDVNDKSRSLMEGLINAPADTVVFVQNATTGTNTILRNLVYGEKDAIIYFHTVYGALERTMLSVKESYPHLHLRKVELGTKPGQFALPCSFADICNAFSQTVSRLLEEGYKPKVAVFDTISSIPGVRFPFEQLTKMCKDHDILSLIDGAHGIGQIPLDMKQLDPDFFVSNLHKWLYTPRGLAALYVPKRNQKLLRTTFPTSWGWQPLGDEEEVQSTPSGKSLFVDMFEYVGTMDYCPAYCVPAAIDFRKDVCGGEEAIHAHIRDVAQQGADLVAQGLGTRVMEDPRTANRDSYRNTLRDCALSNVRLPIKIVDEGVPVLNSHHLDEKDSITWGRKDLEIGCSWMSQTLSNEYNTHLQIFEYGGHIWTRLSGQIYLELKDFERLLEILPDLLNRVRAGEHLQPKPGMRKIRPYARFPNTEALDDQTSKLKVSPDALRS